MWCRLAAAAVVALTVPSVFPQPVAVTLSLEKAGSRREDDFTPAYEGKPVIVTGQISRKPIPILDYVHLAIQDRNEGLILEGKPPVFDQLSPGDWIEARGRVSNRSGLAVVVVNKVTNVSTGAAPVPKPVQVEDLQTFSYLGQLVRTEGTVADMGENSGGLYLQLKGSRDEALKVFLPFALADRSRSFVGIGVGDTVRVTGISYQYCPNPPHDRHFELLVDDPRAVVRTGSAWLSQLWEFRPLLLLLIIPVAVWWSRERSAKAQREMLRTMNALGEEILEAGSAPEIQSRMEAVLPKTFRVTGVRVWVHDRGIRSLAPVTEQPDENARLAFPTQNPQGLVQTAVVTCFQNRSLLSMPDTRRSPFALSDADRNGSTPRSLLLVPMMAHGEPMGVLQIEHARHARNLSTGEKEVAQHLANQVGVAVKFMEQRSFREQLARSEKLAAVGRLISGVVNELHTPLAAISTMAQSALEAHGGPAHSASSHELLVIASEARRASAIVSRMVSFAQPEQVQAEPVELNQVLRSLIRFREREWKACGIQLRSLMKEAPLYVMGSQGQLEQVFLNLFVHAEQSLEDVTEKRLTVRADVLAKRVFVEIGYNAPARAAVKGEVQPAEGEVSVLGLDVCSSIIAGHGGEMRLVRASGGEATFEVELPWLATEESPQTQEPLESREAARRWTALLLEPEEWVERQLIEMLGARGYRVVPVHSSEEGLDLVSRLRFDVLFCSTRLPGLNWIEFFDRVRGRVGAFTLLAEAFSHDLSMHFRGEGRYVLLKPVERSQFDRTLESIEGRLIASEIKAPELESF
ncbi:MAG: hybrid sensor histidine kinase/response regulator [Bryobacteraceae bacterium]